MSNWQAQRAVKVGRTISNMTQRELAAKLAATTGEEWTRAMVAALESGKKAFTVEILIDVAKIQGLPYSFYLEGITTDNPGYAELASTNPLSLLRSSNPTHDPIRDAFWVSLEKQSA